MVDQQVPGNAGDETRKLLEESGAIVENVHCVHISGLHLGMWLNKDAFLPHLQELEKLTRHLAGQVRSFDIDMVCAPAIGGLVVAEWVAHELGVMCVFAEHDPAPAARDLRGRFMLRRGYDELVKGRRVFVVDDCVTTGHSIGETIVAVRNAGGDVSVAGSLIVAGAHPSAQFGLDAFYYLYDFHRPEMWTASECPLCRNGVPINTRYGHGAEFLAERDAGTDET